MPTKRPRHSITETPPVQAALDELRNELGSEKVKLSELVIIGAQEKLSRIHKENRDVMQLRSRLASRIRRQELNIDTDAADEVRKTGWSS